MRDQLKVKQKDPGPAGETAPDRADEKQSREGLFTAILLAFFLHLLLFWATPGEFSADRGEPVLIPQTMELVLEEIPVEPELEETYVRAAPNIEELNPVNTRNISDRDQRAAQEEETLPGPDSTPYVEGDLEESNRLVQGNPFQEPTPQAPPAASPTSGGSPLPQQEAAPKEIKVAVSPDYLEQEPETEEGMASVEKPDTAVEDPEMVPEDMEEVLVSSELDGQGEGRMTTPPQAAEAQNPVPRPRQRVERDTSFGPIKDNRKGVVRIGRLAFDAKYSEFGEYWRRVAEIIEARWRNLVYNTRSIPFGGFKVVVQFAITRDGQVTDVKVGFSDAGKLAETVSVDAIVGEAPFYEWTPEMIVRMGEKAPCAIHFYY
ncbi:MAG: hypothetical protein ACO3ZW_07525 [Opitutales bacterium]|jgi:hypothetical protein